MRKIRWYGILTLLQRRKRVYSLEMVKTSKINKKKVIGVLRLVLVLAILFGGIAWIRLMQVRQYTGYEVLEEHILYSNLVGYKKGNGQLLVCSNDGARAINQSGAVEWEISYQLDNPEITFCEEVAAVADIGGTSVYVVAENGIPYNYSVVYPIVKHEIAGQGVTAVLLDGGKEDYIQLYDKNGTLRVDINTKTKADGIPIDIALSPDGKKLVTLYVTFQGEAMLCKVTFYNADEVGKNYINNIVGQKIFEENQLVYDICFLNEEVLCVLLERGFALYRMSEVPELICEKTFQEEMVECLCVDGGLYVVSDNTAKQRSMTFYNDKGEEKQRLTDIPEYESVTATAEEVVFFSPQRVTVYRANRSMKFSTSFPQSLEAVFPAGNNRYFLVDIGKVQTIKLLKNTNSEEREEQLQ